MSLWEEMDRRIKRFSIIDEKLAQFAAIFFALIIVKNYPQALVMMNSPMINQGISARPGSSLGRLLNEVTNNEDLIVELYLKALAREPSDEEIATCLDYVKEVGNRREAFEDILWSLVNSTEFLHRR